MTRRKWVVGNWKMNTDLASARVLAEAIVKGLGDEQRVGVAVCPPFPYLAAVAETLRGSAVLLGAQNASFELKGAFTGEVSPTMLKDVGCQFVILGHSERRHILGEHDQVINRKVRTALQAGLKVILCVGETLAERENKQMEQVLLFQFDAGLSGVEVAQLKDVILAYEPVWAIGTGQHAKPHQAQEVHELLRRRASHLYGPEAAAALLFLYGGSVNAENARDLLVQPDIDGGLIGGASLKPEVFLKIVQAGLPG